MKKARFSTHIIAGNKNVNSVVCSTRRAGMKAHAELEPTTKCPKPVHMGLQHGISFFFRSFSFTIHKSQQTLRSSHRIVAG